MTRVAFMATINPLIVLEKTKNNACAPKQNGESENKHLHYISSKKKRK